MASWVGDATPTSSYLKGLYKYPQEAFPYDWLVNENRRRGKHDPEFELIDTGIFDQDHYFDVLVEYAKDDPATIDSLAELLHRNGQSELAQKLSGTSHSE